MWSESVTEIRKKQTRKTKTHLTTSSGQAEAEVFRWFWTVNGGWLWLLSLLQAEQELTNLRASLAARIHRQIKKTRLETITA